MSSPLTEKSVLPSEVPTTVDHCCEATEQAQALQQIKRVRTLKFHVTALLVGTVMLGGPWLVVEYLNAGGWPERFRGNGQPGSWDPFIPAVLILWALFVAVQALNFHFRRPPSEQDLGRAVQRLRRG